MHHLLCQVKQHLRLCVVMALLLLCKCCLIAALHRRQLGIHVLL